MSYGGLVGRSKKILLTLSKSEEKRLLELVDSYRSSGRKVTMSDVLRRGLFTLPVQPSLFTNPQGASL